MFFQNSNKSADLNFDRKMIKMKFGKCWLVGWLMVFGQINSCRVISCEIKRFDMVSNN